MCSTGPTSMSGCPTTPTSTRPISAAQQVEQIVREQADVYGKQHPGERRLAVAHPALRHDLGRRWKSALLVLGLAAAQATQLRAGAGTAEQQRDHAGLCQSGAAGPDRQECPACAAIIASCRPIPSTIRWRFAWSARPMSAPIPSAARQDIADSAQDHLAGGRDRPLRRRGSPRAQRVVKDSFQVTLAGRSRSRQPGRNYQPGCGELRHQCHERHHRHYPAGRRSEHSRGRALEDE